ncbi:MAG: hypothetical protein EOM34_09160 [Clostridia bacterium]|nr:hypothetical protein [Lachnospiraceae bacterium]NCC00834.1 hypothetical protein [Clostridia bacterium]NCD02064.1 hypothetical protein [Clostridia bacterium]
MSKEKNLRDINYEMKKVNNNLQRLCNIGMLGIPFEMLKKAREEGDEEAIMLGKIGLALVAVLQVIISISNIVNIYKKKREDDSKEEVA